MECYHQHTTSTTVLLCVQSLFCSQMIYVRRIYVGLMYYSINFIPMVHVFAVVKILNVQHARNCDHPFDAEDTGFVKPIPIESILSKCVSISVGSKSFVGTFPSRVLNMLS